MLEVSRGLKEVSPAEAKAEERDRKLKKACQEFEAVFTYELLKSMRRTVEKCDLFHGGSGEEIYESFLDQELARNMSEQGTNSLAAILYRQLKGKGLEGVETEPLSKGGDNRPFWPLRANLSSAFGWRIDPLDGQNRFHYGIDLPAGQGTLIRASLPGRVAQSGYQEGYGNLVVLDHGGGYTTLYAHNKDNFVNQGDWVRQGDPLASVGSSGRSTGAHLHFEVRKDGKHLDPVSFLGKKD